MHSGLSDEHRSELAACAKALWRSVYGYSMVMTWGDHHLAEDVTQVVFHTAAEQWPDLRCLDESKIEGWLKQVAAKKAVDEFRRNKRVKESWPLVWERCRPHDPDTHHDAMSAIAFDRFLAAVGRLPLRMHHVAVMRWRLGMREQEIANVMGITTKAVSSHLSQARKRLRAEIGDYWPIDHDGPEGGASS